VGGGEEVGTGRESEVVPSQPGTATEGVETEGEMREPVVVIAFPNSLAITRQPLVSVVNTDGYCIVSKTELLNHFLPEGWTGTVVLQLERSEGGYMRMSPGLDIDGTDYLWSLGPGEYKMEVAQPRVPKAGARGTGSSRGPPRMPCSSGPTSVARSVWIGYMSAATSFASGFGGRKISSKIATPTTTTTCLNEGGGKESTQKGVGLNVEKPGIHIGSSSERRSKPIDWARGWSTKARESEEGKVNSTEGKEEGSEKVASGKAFEDSPLDVWARGVLNGGKEKEAKGKRKLEKKVVEEMRGAWDREEGGAKKEKDENKEDKIDENLKERIGGGRGSVLDGVLMSERILATNRLKVLLNRVKWERAEGLEGPVDGDRVVIMSAENYTSRGVRDGRYWGKGQTTSMKTLNGVAVRSWRCGGGRKCENEECGFGKQFGEQNMFGIEMRGNNKWVCFYCNEEVKEPEVECQAVKWTVRNEEEVAYCHMGKHNHDVGKLESGMEKETHQVQVRGKREK
jgi:hypothetical protein